MDKDDGSCSPKSLEDIKLIHQWKMVIKYYRASRERNRLPYIIGTICIKDCSFLQCLKLGIMQNFIQGCSFEIAMIVNIIPKIYYTIVKPNILTFLKKKPCWDSLPINVHRIAAHTPPLKAFIKSAWWLHVGCSWYTTGTNSLTGVGNFSDSALVPLTGMI